MNEILLLSNNYNTSSFCKLMENNNNSFERNLNKNNPRKSTNIKEINILNFFDLKSKMNIYTNNKYLFNNLGTKNIKEKTLDVKKNEIKRLLNNNFQIKDNEIKSNNLSDINFNQYYIKLNSEHKIILLSYPINQNVWLRGRIKKIKLKNKEIYEYYIDSFNTIIMSAIKISRKQFNIFIDNHFLIKIGKISINILGNVFKVKMNNNLENKCNIKYVSKIFYYLRTLIYLDLMVL